MENIKSFFWGTFFSAEVLEKFFFDNILETENT